MLEEKYIDKIVEIMNGLPEFKQLAFRWAICHWKLMNLLCAEEDPLPPEEFEKELQRAIDTKDYVYYALLIYWNVISADAKRMGPKLEEQEES